MNMRTKDWKGRKWPWPVLRYYTNIYLEKLSHDNPFQDRDLNPRYPEYEAANVLIHTFTSLLSGMP
jgi:hypothetical protein